MRSENVSPDRQQLRTFPFNPEHTNAEIAYENGPCSKDCFQPQNNSTPGALTVSCSCAHAVTCETKVLYRKKGTTVVLDMHLSRFARLRRNNVYELVRGLYSSLVETCGALSRIVMS